MQYFLDLEQVAPEFAEQHGLIPLDKDFFESMVNNDLSLEVREYTMDEPAMKHIVVPADKSRLSPMDQVNAAGKAFFEALAEWDGDDMQVGIITDLIAKHCTTESRLQLAFQALTNGHASLAGERPDLTPEGKIFAIQFAETIGPDWAQVLYHFSKLVTKLA